MKKSCASNVIPSALPKEPYPGPCPLGVLDGCLVTKWH